MGAGAEGVGGYFHGGVAVAATTASATAAAPAVAWARPAALSSQNPEKDTHS
jgi:hypothetical protein